MPRNHPWERSRILVKAFLFHEYKIKGSKWSEELQALFKQSVSPRHRYGDGIVIYYSRDDPFMHV